MHADAITRASLAGFWSRLADVGDPKPVPDYDLTAGVGDALAVIEAGSSAPSAGAIFPYECYVICWQTDGLAVFRVDAPARRCRRLPVRADPEFVLAAAGIALPQPGGAHVVVVTRRWLSMRKYGHRGYLYTELDSAHLAVNLLGVARDRDPDAVLHLRIDREVLGELLGADRVLREIHSMISFGPSAEVADVSAWTAADGREAGSSGEFRNPLESACAHVLSPALMPAPELPPVAPRPVPLVVRPRCTPDFLAEPGSWTRLARLRRSSKRFHRRAPIDPDQLSAALGATGSPLPLDLPADGVQLSVVRADQRREPAFLRACMFQRHLVDAQAYVLVHVAIRELVGHRRPQQLREMLFRAGAVGHLLYLGATHAGLGITAVGGFDGPRWAGLGNLPAGHEVLYLLALGQDHDGGVKLDRMQPAYAQAER